MSVGIAGTAHKIRLESVTFDGALVTSTTGGYAVTYTLTTDRGAVLETGNATPDSTAPGTWTKVVSLPAADDLVHVHWRVTKTGVVSPGIFHDVIRVQSVI
jgi:hypothetical protein